MRRNVLHIAIFLIVCGGLTLAGDVARAQEGRARDWPRTDFSRFTVELDEIRSGGVPKDGIPAIDDPRFILAAQDTALGPHEPVISIKLGSQLRAYPLRILLWHEIVNDTVADIPIAVTFCPLCNSAIVFDRRVLGTTLDFGTTGKLRNSDLVMYDRQTESWWQQFAGQAIVGSMVGAQLKVLPSRVESFERFKSRAPSGLVQIPSNPHMRAYGNNPYVGYDSSSLPFLYDGSLPKGIAPLERVIVIGNEAWALPLLEKRRVLTVGDVTIRWEPGQNSALDSPLVTDGRDVGNVTVTRAEPHGSVDEVYDVTFAFAFHAFYPNAPIHTE